MRAERKTFFLPKDGKSAICRFKSVYKEDAMIEIAIDGNLDDSFLGKERPSFVVNSFNGSSFDDYRKEAASFIKYFANQKIVVVRVNQDDFSINMFAVALFVESYFATHNIDCVVFKVENASEAIAQYKPFVALTIGLKYAFTICENSPKRIYNEYTELGYLGVDITKDYFNGEIVVRLNGKDELRKETVNTLQDSIVMIAAIKALSLAKVGANVELKIVPEQNPAEIDKDILISKVVKYVEPWIS